LGSADAAIEADGLSFDFDQYPVGRAPILRGVRKTRAVTTLTSACLCCTKLGAFLFYSKEALHNIRANVTVPLIFHMQHCTETWLQ